MKILIATGIFVPEVGGHSTYVRHLADGLSSKGCQVTVMCYSDKSSYSFDQDFSFAVHRVVRQPEKLKNYWHYGRQLLTAIKDHDLIYLTDTLSVGWLVWLITRFWRRPYLVRISGDVIWEKWLEEREEKVRLVDFYQQGLFKQKRWLFYAVRMIVRGADKIIFNARQLKNLWLRYYNLPEERVVTIYNPLPSIRSVSFGHRPEIFYAGRLSALKNIDLLLRAFAALEIEDLHLVIIGQGPRLKSLQNLAKELGIDHKVEWLPSLPQEELWQRLEQGRGLVLPTLTDISPNIIGEAVVRKYPFLLTRENFLPFAVPPQLLIDIDDVEGLAQKLRWFTDWEKRKELIEMVGTIDWRWSWDGVIQKHWQIITKM